MEVYFDNAATTKPCREAVSAMEEVLCSCYGNPSSTHRMGREAKKVLERARSQVAGAIGAKPEEIFFTSGGSEADNWAIRLGAAKMHHRGKHIISFLAEHDAVRKPLEMLAREGFEITYLHPTASGRVDLAEFEKELREDTILVTVMLVNNETGAANAVGEIAKIIKTKKSKALLHTDAVQALCKIPISVSGLGADMMSLSGHKIHGPKGIGALYIRKGLQIQPLIAGGGQEGGLRAGTEAMPAIAGFGAAAELGTDLLQKSSAYLLGLRGFLTEELHKRIPEMVVIGEGDAPHILSISLPGYRSEVLLNYLDAQGISVSKSSACKKGARSHVLEAMGIPPKVIDGAIRVSLCRYNTKEEAEYFAKMLQNAAESLRRSIR